MWPDPPARPKRFLGLSFFTPLPTAKVDTTARRCRIHVHLFVFRLQKEAKECLEIPAPKRHLELA